MMRHSRAKSSPGAVAAGASATGAAALAAASLGAMALGALAVGALAIGRLQVGRARLGRVEIGELAVGRLRIGADRVAGTPAITCRLRAAPGRGEDLAEFLREQLRGQGTLRALRSEDDPALFLLEEIRPGPAGPEPRLSSLVPRAAGRGLLAALVPVEVDLFRTL